MLILAGSIRLPADRLDDARPTMERMIAASRAEPGCLGYSFAADLLEPGLIRIFEMFADEEALRAHSESAHMQEWRDAWEALGIGERQITLYGISRIEER